MKTMLGGVVVCGPDTVRFTKPVILSIPHCADNIWSNWTWSTIYSPLSPEETPSWRVCIVWLLTGNWRRILETCLCFVSCILELLVARWQHYCADVNVEFQCENATIFCILYLACVKWLFSAIVNNMYSHLLIGILTLSWTQFFLYLKCYLYLLNLDQQFN